MNMSWESIAAVVGIIATFASATLFLARPVIVSDDPPWANVGRVEQSAAHIAKKIDILERNIRSGQLASQILGMWRGMCDATRERNTIAAGVYAARMTELQEEYQMLNSGVQYPIARCL